MPPITNTVFKIDVSKLSIKGDCKSDVRDGGLIIQKVARCFVDTSKNVFGVNFFRVTIRVSLVMVAMMRELNEEPQKIGAKVSNRSPGESPTEANFVKNV